MKRILCFSLVFLLFCLSGCKSMKKNKAADTTAAAGESAGAPVENAQDPAAPASAFASSASISSASAVKNTTTVPSVASEQSVSSGVAASAGDTLSKEEIGRLLVTANDLTLGWLNIGFTAKAHFDQNDSYDKLVNEYTIPYIRISGADYGSVEELKAAVARVYTAEAAEIFDGFIDSMYEMHDGKFYADSAIGQGGDTDGVRASVKILSQTANECRLQVDYFCDPTLGQSAGGYKAGDLIRSETLTLKKENDGWKFTSPVSIFGLYFNWYQLTWAE